SAIRDTARGQTLPDSRAIGKLCHAATSMPKPGGGRSHLAAASNRAPARPRPDIRVRKKRTRISRGEIRVYCRQGEGKGAIERQTNVAPLPAAIYRYSRSVHNRTVSGLWDSTLSDIG